MLTEALRNALDWGSELSNGAALGLGLKELVFVAGVLMGGTWLVATEFNARDERAAATESDVRLLSQSVARLSDQIAEVSERQDSMDRRIIQYHAIVMEQVEDLARKLDREIDMPPPPYRDFGDSQ